MEWLKRLIARKELEELDSWRLQWHEHRRWMAEFGHVALTLDHMKANVDGEPVSSIHIVRDSMRKAQK